MERGDRRAQLLKVANRIVAADGITGLTMERLSELARISKPVVYSHFANRSDLLIALLQNYWDEVDRKVPGAPREGQTFEQHLRESVHGHLEVVLNGAGAVRHLLHTVIEDPVIEDFRVSREQRVVRRWTEKTMAYYKIPREKAEFLAIVYRGALEAGTSHVSRFPDTRRGVEELCITMGLATLNAISHR